MSTESNPDDTTDESSGSRLTRREALAVLGSGGAALALSGASAQSGEGNFNIGGGDMADQLSHIQANVYRGPESELPDPGVENRIYKITEADGSTYSSGDILEDTGDAWQVMNIGVGSLNAANSKTTGQNTVQQHHNRNLGAWHSVGEMWDPMNHTLSGSDFGPWSVVHGSAEVDEDNWFTAGQSLKLTHDVDGIKLERGVSGLDLESHRFAIAGRIEAGDHGTVRFDVDAEDAYGDMRRLTGEFRSYDESEDTTFLYANFGLNRTGTSRTNLSDIQKLTFKMGNGLENGDSFWLDSFRLVPVPSPGRIFIDFDFGVHEDAYEKYAPILSEYGYTPSVSGGWEQLDQSSRMTTEQARELSDERGWLFRPHIGFRNLHDEGDWPYSDEDYRETILERLETVEDDLQRERGKRFFSFLGGQIPDARLPLVQEYADVARRGSDRVIGVPANPLDIPAPDVDDGLSVTGLQEHIGMVAEHGGYFGVFAHLDDRLGENDLRDILDEIQQYEDEGKLVVKNIADLYDEWQSFRASSVDNVRPGGRRGRRVGRINEVGATSVSETFDVTRSMSQGDRLFLYLDNFSDADGEAELHLNWGESDKSRGVRLNDNLELVRDAGNTDTVMVANVEHPSHRFGGRVEMTYTFDTRVGISSTVMNSRASGFGEEMLLRGYQDSGADSPLTIETRNVGTEPDINLEMEVRIARY